MLSFQMPLRLGVIYAAMKWYVCTQNCVGSVTLCRRVCQTAKPPLSFSSRPLSHLWTFFFNTHSITALVLHSLSSTQSEVFPSMAQVPCIVNERMYKLKTQKLRAKECNLGRYQVTFREPFVKIPTIINFPILQHIPCLPHQLFQYLLKYITASVERVCSPWANYSSEP